jgi:DNA/RNA-binding domain of Phe-tRNA-synthetase-like protein
MLTITVTNEWKTIFPGAQIGILEIAGVKNTHQSPQLEAEKRAVELRLRARYAGYSRSDFLALPVLAAYNRYYKRFDKTYHVLLQLESVVLKDKHLPEVSPLVDANFAAELDTLVLTAGHDVARLHPPLLIDVSRVGDEFTRMNGGLKRLPPGDMVMHDSQGIICTILYGQDNISPISASTTHALYVAYAPPGVGIGEVQAQLDSIEKNIRLFSADCRLVQKLVLGAAN